MARSMMWLVFGCGAVVAWLSAVADEPIDRAGVRATGGLITHVLQHADGPAQLIVVDPERLVVSVYHISQDPGEIELKSVREIRWDLQLTEFNSSDPLPEHIRNMLERQR